MARRNPQVMSSELLGFPPDARLLIVNADDLGMYPGVNMATMRSIEEGLASSCSLMAPCPSAPNALELLRHSGKDRTFSSGFT